MVRIEFPRDFKEFLQLLNSKEIEYLVIGGYAVGYHGYPRATGDMDVWTAINDNNALKMANALKVIKERFHFHVTLQFSLTAGFRGYTIKEDYYGSITRKSE